MRTRGRLWAAGVALAAVVAGSLYFAGAGPAGPPPDAPVVVIVPFRTIDGEAGGQALGRELAGAVSAGLEEWGRVRVRLIDAGASGGSSPPGDLIEAGRDLGGHFVLDGRLVRQNQRIRGRFDLLDVTDGAPRWRLALDEPHADMTAVSDKLVASLVEALLEGDARTAGADDLQRAAHDAYEKGRYFWNTRTAVGLNRSITYLERAVEADPENPRASAGLAAAYAFDTALWPKAEALAGRALELDPTSADAHAVLGFIRMFWQWRWSDAEQEFRRAIALDPRNPTARQWYAIWLVSASRNMEALAVMTEAMELDPFSASIRADLGQIHYFSEQYDEAIARGQEALQVDPDFVVALLYLYDIYLAAGRYDQAVATFFQAAELLKTHPVYNRSRAASLRRAYETSGIEGFWRAVIDLPAGRQDAYVAAEHLARLGEIDAAVESLRAAVERGSGLLFLRVNPALHTLRTHPGFAALIRRIGTPELLVPRTDQPVASTEP